MSRFNSHMRTWRGACIAGLRAALTRLAAERSGIRHAHASRGDRDLVEDTLPLQGIGLCAAAQCVQKKGSEVLLFLWLFVNLCG